MILPMLKVIDLEKVYPTGAKALRSVSFAVDEPHVIAIIGPSGAGKSTLIRCINRLVEPTSGKVMLDDIDVASVSRRELRKVRRRMGKRQKSGLCHLQKVVQRCRKKPDDT